MGLTIAAVPDAPALGDAMAALRAREFAYLDEQRLTYLDFTGAALPAESQLRAHDALLRGQVLGDPHSEHAPSRAASVRIHGARRVGAATAAAAPRLFAYPAQSNFSGVRHPLSLVASAQQLGYTALLDAAAFVPTSRLDLRRVRPDFVTMSFYKLFGIPTGIGAREPFSPQPGSRERHRDAEVPACGYPPGWSEDARCATVESSSRELPRLAVLCASVPLCLCALW